MDTWIGTPLNTIYAGVSELHIDESQAQAAVVVRSPTELLGFFICKSTTHKVCNPIEAVPVLIMSELQQYSEMYKAKVIAVAIPQAFSDSCPCFSLSLWRDFDIIPIVIERKHHIRRVFDRGELATFHGWDQKEMDEQADSMVRKCIRSFGIGNVPLMKIDQHGQLEVDHGFRIRLADTATYKNTVSSSTWSQAQHFASDLRQRGTRVAFFGTAPHTKPDIRTKHALVRLSHCLGADLKCYIARPRPQLILISQRMHKILEGTSGAGDEVTTGEQLLILEWAYATAKRYWLCKGGPLQPASDGGAHIVVIDHPILSPLALISKQVDPKRPVVFESHIHSINSQTENGDPKSRVLEFIRARMEHVDLLVCQEPRETGLSLMSEQKTGYIPVSVDQIDGLNKEMSDREIAFYGREFNSFCRIRQHPVIDYPKEQYILHLSQLLPQDCTFILLDAYQRFYHECTEKFPDVPIPKFLICHSGPAYGLEASIRYDSLLNYIKLNMAELFPHICVMQLGPPDQLWNALLSKARFVVELSNSKGISEVLLAAVRKHKPIITSRNNGLLSYISPGNNASLVAENDVSAIADNFLSLTTNFSRYYHMSVAGLSKPPGDNTTTVGNGCAWFYLLSRLSSGVKVEPCGQDIYKLAQVESKDE